MNISDGWRYGSSLTIDVLIVEIEVDQHVRSIPHRSRHVGPLGEQRLERLDRNAWRAIPCLVISAERRQVHAGRLLTPSLRNTRGCAGAPRDRCSSRSASSDPPLSPASRRRFQADVESHLKTTRQTDAPRVTSPRRPPTGARRVAHRQPTPRRCTASASSAERRRVPQERRDGRTTRTRAPGYRPGERLSGMLSISELSAPSSSSCSGAHPPSPRPTLSARPSPHTPVPNSPPSQTVSVAYGSDRSDVVTVIGDESARNPPIGEGPLTSARGVSRDNRRSVWGRGARRRDPETPRGSTQRSS